MSTMTISQASELIWDLIQTLEDAYWEASNCEEKDQVFNLMQLLNAEYMELLKVSIQDHHYEYEVISTGLVSLQQALEDFQIIALKKTRRLSTSSRLGALLNKLSATLSKH
ncbi:hypothetical protein [Thalassolituus hydrocarboniclasticus]|uniref:Flagellar protein FliT n=1 Tax=Thalassolituus hydrocarboniclasticus TaxID=2742796 RepID=A0ABY6A8V8_9GAMM|nr:hypothetical protein [Thalassolituus hydrocarboniclasticus]UXD87035.1 hypothetical protein HUF19_06075 [Thalassolituus hydrocarboniclasticus]